MKIETEKLLAEASRLRVQGRRAEAIGAYRRLLSGEPALPDSWYNLGLLLRDEGRFEEALAAYGEALARGIEEPGEVRLSRAFILAEHLRREEEAEAEYRALLKIDPGSVPARLNLGNLLEERGEREAAAASYEAILPPEQGVAPHHDLRCEALARLVQLREPQSATDPLIERLEDAARGGAFLDLKVRANLLYALGQALDAVGAYDRAFAAFEEANRCVRKAGPDWRRSAIEAEVGRLIEAFPVATAARAATEGPPQPVFICGMFRSGSTLVEQALAAHPSVIAGGELNLLNRLTDATLAPYPQSMRTLDDKQARALAEGYLADLRLRFPECEKAGAIVTDKRPDNFLRIGLIKRLFPEAKLIHTVRDPADTCLSVYFQHIDQRLVGYASDLSDTGHYFGQYRRMMAHWKTLYPNDIFDFDYDRFVADPRPALEALLSFLGLPWDERCLSFHELKNPVKTASYWQVRKPLYRGSSGRRRHYDRHLGPLCAALREAGVELP